jgi:hypothetical protein
MRQVGNISRKTIFLGGPRQFEIVEAVVYLLSGIRIANRQSSADSAGGE